MATRNYELRASAARAAKKAGLARGQFEVRQLWEEGGKSHWIYEAKSTATATPVDTAAADAPAGQPTAPPRGADDGPARKLLVEDYADQPKKTPTPVAKPAPALTPKPARLSKSTVEKPTKAVWAIADEMTKANPKVSRKDIIYECMQRGIAYYTARTQLQIALRKMKANAM